MRRHRLDRVAVLAALLAVGIARDSRADESTFDFVSARADQSGAYTPTGNAIVSGGFGTLAPIAGWVDEGWRYRLPVTLNNPNASPLLEWPLALVANASTAGGYDLFNLAQADAGDLRLYVAGTQLMPVSRGYWDLGQNRGRLWLRLDALAAGNTNLEIYFGNYGIGASDDPASIFTYSAPYASRYALESFASTMNIASSVGANDYATGATTGTAVAGDVIAVLDADWAQGQTIASDGPVEVAFATDGAGEAAPIAFARTQHALVINRGAGNNFHLLAPFANTTVTITENGSSIGTVALTAGVAATFSSDVGADAVVGLSAASPFLVAHNADDAVDGVVFPPPATDVWGFRSGTPRVLAVSADANITIWDSTGAVATQTITAGSFATLTAGGSGDADAIRILSDAPITVIGTADGDGGDSIVFHPESELGRQWVVPTTGHFVQIALTQGGTDCTLTPPAGTATTVTASTSFPGRVLFGTDGSSSIVAGSRIECEAPGFAIYEDAATDDERNLYPMESHRKALDTAPTATLGDALDTRYDASAASTIETPELQAPTAVVAWTDFRVAVNEPAGSTLRYQLSIDGGNTWLVPNGGAWVDAVTSTNGVTEADIRDNLDTLSAATGRLRARVILHAEDGVTRPSIDAIRVFYDAAGDASRLRWAPLPTTVLSAESIDAVITAVDGDGTTITGLDAELALTSSHQGMVLPATVTMTAGVAQFSLRLTGAGDDVSVRAESPDGLVGYSSTFDLLTPDGARLEKVSGDDQFGLLGQLLGEPFAVRVLDASDAPIGGVQVTYAVLEGGGSMEPGGASAVTITDGSGVARGFLRLGPAEGANKVRVEAAGSMVEFVARADEGTGTEDGGCCDVGGQSPAGTLLLALWVGVAIARRRGSGGLARGLLR